MKREDIYIGKVKKCRNVYNYTRYGDSRYVPDFRINKTEFGTIENYAYEVDSCAVLIKATANQFIWLKSVTSFLDEAKVNLGFSVNTLATLPTQDGELFVDSDSLVQYYSDNLDKNISVKSLRRDTLMDVRIPGGIEY